MNYLIMLVGEATTLAEEATTLDVSGGGSASVWDTIKAYGFPVLMIVGLVLVFWLLIIRPQKKQEKETQKMRNSIMVGDTNDYRRYQRHSPSDQRRRRSVYNRIFSG